MTDEDALKEVKAKLLGRVDITHYEPNSVEFGRFLVQFPDGSCTIFNYARDDRREIVWKAVVRHIRLFGNGAVIFGPPGFDTDL